MILCLLLKVLTFSSAQEDNRTELHIAFIASFGGEHDSSVAVPAVRLAASKPDTAARLQAGGGAS